MWRFPGDRGLLTVSPHGELLALFIGTLGILIVR